MLFRCWLTLPSFKLDVCSHLLQVLDKTGLGLGGWPPLEMIFEGQGGWGLANRDKHMLGIGGGGLAVLSGWRELSRPEPCPEPASVSCSLPRLTFLTQQHTMGVTFALITHGAICSCLPSFDVILQMARTGWKWHTVEYGTVGASVPLKTSLTRCEHNNGDYIMTWPLRSHWKLLEVHAPISKHLGCEHGRR